MPESDYDDDSLDDANIGNNDNNNNDVHIRIRDYSNDDSFLDANSNVNQREGCYSRIKSDMMDFNGSKRCCSQSFIFIDCILQNLILYLIWFQFIPVEEGDTEVVAAEEVEEDDVFFSRS